jgi:predicted O-methyltransferase YrrM
MGGIRETVSKSFVKSKKALLLLKMLLGKKAMATDPSPVVSKMYYALEQYSIEEDVRKVHSKVMGIVGSLSVKGAKIYSTRRGITYYDIKRLLAASTLGKYGMVLAMIAKYFAPKMVLELGTYIGVSAMYIAGGLEAANGGGVGNYSLTSVEASKSLIDIAKENLRKFGVDERRCNLINDYFENVLPSFSRENTLIDFVFVDGSHTYEATLKYFNWLIGNMRNDGIMMFDDIRWSQGMFEAWKDICSHKSIGISVDLGAMGLCVVKHDRPTCSKKHFSFRV